MHDTNNKTAFKKESRFLSHGCIRLEKPIDLANELLPNDVDAGFLKACVHGQSPISKRVPEAVPVFVLYMTADVVHGGVKYYKDVYNLM
jgi:murein L,D-transpeptidase YcbB/YkuD